MEIPAHVPTLTSKYIISTTGLYSTTTGDVTWFVRVCVPSWPRIKEEQPQMNPVERKFSCMGGSRLSGTMSCNGKLFFSGTCPMNSKKYVCWLHLANPWAFLLPVLALLVNVGSAGCCSEVTDKCFSSLPALPGIPWDTCPPVSALVLGTVPEKPWTLGCSNNQWNQWFLWFPMTCLQFRLHTVQMRNLETRRSAGGDHPPQCEEKDFQILPVG